VITGLAGKTISGGRLNVDRAMRSCSGSAAAPITQQTDFNGDGKADLVWQNVHSGEIGVWSMDGIVTASSAYFVPGQYPDTTWKIVGTGAFNCDRRSDLVWQQPASGEVGVWLMNGIVRASALYFTPGRVADAQWQVVGVDDFNNDGKSDLFWQHQTTGDIGVWFMNGTVMGFSAYANPHRESDLRWQIVASGDFNQDSKADLVWQRSDTADIRIWLMDGLTRIAESSISVPPQSDSNWKIVGTEDFNADGRSELVLRHTVSGQFGTWSSDNEGLVFGPFLGIGEVADLNWHIRNR
jgi:hypothetical protein